jgi:hypothetical protein
MKKVAAIGMAALLATAGAVVNPPPKPEGPAILRRSITFL